MLIITFFLRGESRKLHDRKNLTLIRPAKQWTSMP
uniref:Uncharacterized protein n=1 Tax=Arundo donax TaxID=35708 RepID=A0A0A8ZLY3_ARUDO